MPIYGAEASVLRGLVSCTLLLQDDIMFLLPREQGDKGSQREQIEDFVSSVLSRTVRSKSIIYNLLSPGHFVIESSMN